MRFTPRSRKAALLAVATLVGAPLAAADAAVVASVGSAQITAAEVTNRLAQLSAFELRALGGNSRDVKEAVLGRILVPERLHALEAARLGLEADSSVEFRFQLALAETLEQELAEQLEAGGAVTREQIDSYYAQHRSEFEAPEAVSVWRIVVENKKLAEQAVEQAKGMDGPKRWAQLAREHSLDKATGQRKGNLGFVRPDGSTDVPRVRVDPKVFAAVAEVADGALVPEPVEHEGKYWALWRRGSRPARRQDIEQAAGAIRKLLERQRLVEHRQALLRQLRSSQLTAENLDLLSHLPAPSFGDVPQRGGSSTR